MGKQQWNDDTISQKIEFGIIKRKKFVDLNDRLSINWVLGRIHRLVKVKINDNENWKIQCP